MDNKNITVIPARRTKTIETKKEDVKKIRVAAYARVSTENEEQESSYEMQVKHYTDYINSKPEWELVKVYADDGISGTNTKKREAFNEMIEDARAGKIDKILTKSISRFSRNTVDCLKYTRELKDLNVGVYFEKENIDTLDAKGEILMTIMAALAQQESESLSANVRLGIQYRNQQGIVRINCNHFLGYDKDENGKLVINQEEAEIVRRIYREYLEGKSLIQIKKGLEKDGVKNGVGNTKWWDSNIKQILQNEKYIGDALLQKTYTSNLLEKKRKKNEGALPQYYVEGNHEPIISKEIFLKVQAELKRRSSLATPGSRRCYSGKYALSHITFCGVCGNIYRRVTWQGERERVAVWRCVSRMERKFENCGGRTVNEEEIHDAVIKAINLTFRDKTKVKQSLKENLKELNENGINERIDEIDKELKKLQRDLIDVKTQEENSRIGNEIVSLREEKDALQVALAYNKDYAERTEEMERFLDENKMKVKEFDDVLVRKLIKKVTIHPSSIIVTFHTGLELEVETEIAL